MRKEQDAKRWGVFSSLDVAIMRHAYQLAVRDGLVFDDRDEGEMLARAIMQTYNLGVADPHKLADVAAMVTSSKLFRPQSSNVFRAGAVPIPS